MAPVKSGKHENVTEKDDIRITLDGIFEQLENREQGKNTSSDKTKELNRIANAARELMGEVLGTADDYKLQYKTIRDSTGEYKLQLSGADLKVPRDQDSHRVCDAIILLLDLYGIPADLSIDVFRSIETSIYLTTIRFRFDSMTGEIEYIPQSRWKENLLVETPIEYYIPKAAVAAKGFLLPAAEGWLQKKIKEEIESLSLADKLADIEGRLIRSKNKPRLRLVLNEVFTDQYYIVLLLRIKAELDNELVIEKKRLANNMALEFGRNQTKKRSAKDFGDEVLGKTGIKHKRHSMQTFDRTALFFHYLFDQADARAKNIDMAKVVHFLTAYSEERLEQKFSGSNVYGEEGDEKFLRDLKVVIALFQKLKMAKIIRQIKDEHPEVESIR